jgi:hypothetical protein
MKTDSPADRYAAEVRASTVDVADAVAALHDLVDCLNAADAVKGAGAYTGAAIPRDRAEQLPAARRHAQSVLDRYATSRA